MNMVELEVDGSKVEVAPGSTVMDAARKLGIYVPHFCYHKHLSIAANCRMCLVEVEKAPKPLPACATPVSAGMIVRTAAPKAKQAQAAVMEFLLINHPLDCPICDQGGECQLQDLAVGYGASASRYQEEKRVVFQKNLGPLVSAAEMSRCIQCTRCVRFGQELGGQMELGMANRGEHSEIMSFLGSNIDSEVSGNMIDICPVGALTSKPFRYSARTWELARRKTISPHDGLGSNLIAQVKNNEVLRVVPHENEQINDCWLSDKDRFSYEATHSSSRLQRPRLKTGNQWQDVSWQQALDFVVGKLRTAMPVKGSIGMLATPQATVEELFLLDRLSHSMGQLYSALPRVADAGWQQLKMGTPWFGMPITELAKQQQILMVGSFLRKDHPLLALKLRTAKNLKVHSLHALAQDWALPLATRGTQLLRAPSQWVQALAEVAKALGVETALLPSGNIEVSEQAQIIAEQLRSAEHKAIMLGNAVCQMSQTAQIVALTQAIAEKIGASFGFLTEAANTVGAHLLGEHASPIDTVLSKGHKVMLLLNNEPELDCYSPQLARQAMDRTECVIALTTFSSNALESTADVMLPIAPFTESAGSFVNCEGRLQSFQSVTEPKHEARPLWKVLRVLGNLLELPGFEFETAAQVLQAATSQAAINAKLNNQVDASRVSFNRQHHSGLERVADVPIYFSDALVRRAHSLQLTKDAQAPVVSLSTQTWNALGLNGQAAKVKVSQGGQQFEFNAVLDAGLAAQSVRLATAHASTSQLGAMFAPIEVERA